MDTYGIFTPSFRDASLALVWSSHDDASIGNIFHVTGALCREFSGHRWIPLIKASDMELWCIFDLRLNELLGKQSRRWWFDMPSCSLWRHCNVTDPVLMKWPWMIWVMHLQKVKSIIHYPNGLYFVVARYELISPIFVSYIIWLPLCCWSNPEWYGYWRVWKETS